MTADTETRRLTPTERLHEVTMAAMHRAPSPPEHLVTIARNAKGVAQFEVTVRGADAGECKVIAQRIYDTLARAYPYAEQAPPDTASEKAARKAAAIARRSA